MVTSDTSRGRARVLLALATFAHPGAVACAADKEAGEATGSDASAGTSGATATSTQGVTTTGAQPDECRSFTTAETCPPPCSWLSYPTYADAASCDPGDEVALCVYVSANLDQGCQVFDACDDPWGYIALADGRKAMAAYCGQTPPEGWTQCGLDDIEGGVPECACACPGAASTSGTTSGTASGSTSGAAR